MWRGLGDDRSSSATAAGRARLMDLIHGFFLSAGRALALGDAGAPVVLWRAGGLRRASGPRRRAATVAAEAPRTRNGVYLMVAPAGVTRRAQPLVLIGIVVGLLAGLVALGTWFFLGHRPF